MSSKTKMSFLNPMFTYSLLSIVTIFIVALVATSMSGCSDSNLPTFVSSSELGSASGVFYHGELQVAGLSGYVSFIDTITGNAILAAVSTQNSNTSTFTTQLPPATYNIDVDAITFLPGPGGAEAGSSVTIDVPNDTITIFGNVDSFVPAITVSYNSP